jgi:hypothetical protein
MPTIDLTADEYAAITAGSGAPSKKTVFLAPRASIRCARR